MGKIEEVKKILDECVDDYYRTLHPIDEIAREICRLVEPRPAEGSMCVECHGTGRHYYASPSGGAYVEDTCITCDGKGYLKPKPDEGEGDDKRIEEIHILWARANGYVKESWRN